MRPLGTMRLISSFAGPYRPAFGSVSSSGPCRYAASGTPASASGKFAEVAMTALCACPQELLGSVLSHCFCEIFTAVSRRSAPEIRPTSALPAAPSARKWPLSMAGVKPGQCIVRVTR
ncbi:MAG: hypothetical protein HOV83_09025 [Catenulispora sp.]|nr:hypothetical protein [Catenulispora sp.]